MAAAFHVCTGGMCGPNGGHSLVRDIEELIGGRCPVEPSACLGKCEKGPVVEIVSKGSTTVHTEIDSYAKAATMFTSKMGIYISDLRAEVGQMKFDLRRGEFSEDRIKGIEQCIAAMGGEEAARQKDSHLFSELLVIRSRETMRSKPQDSLADAELATELFSDFPQAHLQFAKVLEVLGHFADAAAAIEFALGIGHGVDRLALKRQLARLQRKVDSGESKPRGAGDLQQDEPRTGTMSMEDSLWPFVVLKPRKAKSKAKAKAKAKATATGKAAGDAAKSGKATDEATEKVRDRASDKASAKAAAKSKTTPSSVEQKQPVTVAAKAIGDLVLPQSTAADGEELLTDWQHVSSDLDDDAPDYIDWQLDSSTKLNEDCIAIELSCTNLMQLQRMLSNVPSPGEVWHLDIKAEISGEKIVRAYTPISTVRDLEKGRLHLMIKVYTDGKMTQFLSEKVVGNLITISAPHPTLNPAKYMGGAILVAGGSAVTVALQFSQAIFTFAKGAERQPTVHLVLCNRTVEDALYRDEFAKLQELQPSLRVLHCISQGRVLVDASAERTRGDWHAGRASPELLHTLLLEDMAGVVSGPPGLCHVVLSAWQRSGRAAEHLTVLDDAEPGGGGSDTAAEQEEKRSPTDAAAPAPPAKEEPECTAECPDLEECQPRQPPNEQRGVWNRKLSAGLPAQNRLREMLTTERHPILCK